MGKLIDLTRFACVVLKHDARAMCTLAACYERRANAPGDVVPIIERRAQRVKRTLTNAVNRKGRKTA